MFIAPIQLLGCTLYEKVRWYNCVVHVLNAIEINYLTESNIILGGKGRDEKLKK